MTMRSRWSRSIRQAPARPARRRTVRPVVLPVRQAAMTAAAAVMAGVVTAVVATAVTDASASRSHHRQAAYHCKTVRQSDTSTWCADHIARALISRHGERPNHFSGDRRWLAISASSYAGFRHSAWVVHTIIARQSTSGLLVVYISTNRWRIALLLGYHRWQQRSYFCHSPAIHAIAVPACWHVLSSSSSSSSKFVLFSSYPTTAFQDGNDNTVDWQHWILRNPLGRRARSKYEHPPMRLELNLNRHRRRRRSNRLHTHI
jgi:hypothetical protein